jgi:hypothetical protein
MQRIIGLAGLVMILGLVFAVGSNWDKVKILKLPLSAKKTTIAPIAPTAEPGLYVSTKSKYQVLPSRNWNKVETLDSPAFESRVVFTPKAGIISGTLSEMDITVIPSPKSGQELSTEKEMTDWRSKKDGVLEKDGIKKVSNVTVDGNDGVVLIKEDAMQWVLVVWLRKGTVNYYINFVGTGSRIGDDDLIRDAILRSFKFL